MSFRSVLLSALLLQVSFSMAQSSGDTVRLEEIRIYGIPQKEYAAGSKITHVDSFALRHHASSNLAELIAQRSPLYFKTYGAGIATVAFRGTSANHTAVLWNGININSISLGLSDFSTFPAAASDNVSIQYGSSSALYGSGAIGGTIHMYGETAWEEGFKGSLRQEVGSFGHYYSEVAVNMSNGRVENKTKAFLKSAQNDFPYKAKGINGVREMKQANADLQHTGVIQDIYYRIHSNQYVSLNFWYNRLDRNIQPPISSPQNQDHQLDENVRIVANYHLNNRWGYFNPRLGYLYDVINFNGEPSATQRYIAALQHEIKLRHNLKISGGADFTHIKADVKGYGGEKQEDRADVFLLSKYSPWERLRVSLNVRQSFVTNFDAPIAPSLGLEYAVWNNEKMTIEWKSNLSRSYRIPTLNDRHWSPGGNLELESETGFTYESGVAFSSQSEQSKLVLELTGYFNNVDNWIIWLTSPGQSYWSPENIDKVHARGLEISSSWSSTFGEWDMALGANYAFSRATHANKPDRKYGQQLMYVPKHNGAAYVIANFRGWYSELNAQYTGSRLTTIDILEPYWLAHFSFGKNMTFGGHLLTASLKINNLLNKEYINYESRAMPGRNYNLSLTYTLNK